MSQNLPGVELIPLRSGFPPQLLAPNVLQLQDQGDGNFAVILMPGSSVIEVGAQIKPKAMPNFWQVIKELQFDAEGPSHWRQLKLEMLAAPENEYDQGRHYSLDPLLRQTMSVFDLAAGWFYLLRINEHYLRNIATSIGDVVLTFNRLSSNSEAPFTLMAMVLDAETIAVALKLNSNDATSTLLSLSGTTVAIMLQGQSAFATEVQQAWGQFTSVATGDQALSGQLPPSLPGAVIDLLRAIRKRALTTAEIDDILLQIPPLPALDTLVARVHHEEILSHLREQLTGKMINPIQIDRLKEINRNKYLYSLMSPYEQVGVGATECIMAPVMQNTLSSRHKFGTSAGMSATIELFQEVLLNQNIREPEMTIFFEDRHITEAQILDYKHLFEQIYIGDLMLSYSTVATGTLESWWWQAYLTLSGVQINFPHDIFLRLELNVDLMFDHEISVDNIISVITEFSPSVIAIPSPLFFRQESRLTYCFIDIIADKEKAKAEIKDDKKKKKVLPSISDDAIEMAFITIIVRPSLAALKISGLAGISKIEPRAMELFSKKNGYIVSERSAAGPELPPNSIMENVDPSSRATGQLELRFNPYFLRRNCLLISDFIPVLQLLQFRHIGIVHTEDRLAGETEEFPSTVGSFFYLTDQLLRCDWPLKRIVGAEQEKTVLSYVQLALAMEEKAWKTRQSERREHSGNKYYVEPLTPLLQYNRIFFAQASGTNLRDVCLLDPVDSRCCYSNSPKEMLDIFGIEVAFVLIVKILLDVLDNTGTPLNLAHVKLLSEFKCNQGIVLGLDYHGLDKQANETLAKATAIGAVRILAKSASTGVLEENRSVSTAVLTGTLAKFGANMVTVLPPPPVAAKLMSRVTNSGTGAASGSIATIARKAQEEIRRQQEMAQVREFSDLGGDVAVNQNATVNSVATVNDVVNSTGVNNSTIATPLTVAQSPTEPQPAGQMPNFQNKSLYTERAAENIHIPMKAGRNAYYQAEHVATTGTLHDLQYFGLPLPALIERVINAGASTPSTLGIQNAPIAPTVPSVTAAPKLSATITTAKPSAALNSLASMVRAAKK